MTETKFAGLDLQGYKTFAKETNLVFPAQITAIVGPNGSGKSNVADAIRWVLGEQSYSLLRAKRTEDMIYSGSDSRARAGMAAVSISFSNETKWLPIDYSEVVLTRRAYRDGKNEYLINNQRVRLKDFSELLGKTGLSDRTYTIIGQGLVDTALSIRPDERSKLFEEAAGIGLYQSRKEEALRRLSATERNLERVLDIIAELKPRVRNLEKQAARVSEYKTVQESLKHNLREWYGFHWYKALREANVIKEQLNSAELERQSARKTIEQEQGDSSNLRDQIDEQRIKVNKLMDELRELRDQHQSDNQKLAILDERRAAALKGKQQGQSDLTGVEEVIRSAEEKSNSWQVDEEKVRAELENVIERLEELKERRTLLLEQEKAFVKEDARLRDALVELDKETIVVRSRKEEMIDRTKEIKQVQANILETLASLGEEEKSLSSVNIELATQIRETEQKTEQLRKEFDVARIERAELMKELETHQQSSHTLDLERNRVKNRLELIRQSRESLAGFSDGAKSLLKTNREKKVHDDLTDLATHIEVPEKYETAISAALGEAVDVLIIRDRTLGSHLVEELSSNLDDRVAILGKSERQITKIQTPIDQSLIFASKIVKTEPSLESVVELLLGDFVITSSLKEAFANREKYPNLNFVTVDGAVLLSNGITIIGKANKSSKVSYSRLIKELSSDLEEITKTKEQINTVLDQSQKKIDLNDKKIQNIELALDQNLKTKAVYENDFSDNSLSLEKAINRVSWMKRQDHENLTLLEKLEKGLAEHEIIEKNNAKQRELLLTEQKELKSQRAEFDPGEVENQYHYLETEKQVLNQRLQHLSQSNKSERSRLEADRIRRNQILERITAQESTLKEISDQIANLTEKVDEDKRHIDEMDNLSLKPELSRLREMENQSRVLSEADSVNQKALTEKDRQVIHYQLELAHQQERLENLKTRIDDDFSLIEMEYRNEQRLSSPLPFPDLVIETLPEKLDLSEELAESIKQQKAQLRRIGTVNLEADHEYREVKERYDNLNLQVTDLNAALRDIEEMIKELDVVMKRDFLETYKAVSTEFSRMFARLFNGGSARLMLNDEESPIDGGIEIEARLPGKREQGLVLLSGGERSLTAVALVFALLKVSPTPFCVLDEVDAMLDESNVGRFIELLKDLSTETQFVLITHNRNTVSAADVIYGVTMGKDSASQVISLRLDEVDDDFIN